MINTTERPAADREPGIKAIDVRFFIYGLNQAGDIDLFEACEAEFFEASRAAGSVLTYDHNTVFQNGVRQLCLSVLPSDLETIEDAAGGAL